MRELTLTSPIATTTDSVEVIRGALVQHGPRSDRVYLLEPGAHAESDIAAMEELAYRHGYSKLFAKVPEDREQCFLDSDFITEARIPGGVDGLDLVFCSRFLSAEREAERLPDEVQRTLRIAACMSAERQSVIPSAREAEDYDAPRLATPLEADELASFYGKVFASYPFPIDDPQFIRASMAEGTIYLIIRSEIGHEIAAAASAEPLWRLPTCEMTDFATLPEWRGLGLASVLLQELERKVMRFGTRMAFTIARATSPAMNVVFARHGYVYAGTLVNNTNIAGRIESMNVWFRPLA